MVAATAVAAAVATWPKDPVTAPNAADPSPYSSQPPLATSWSLQLLRGSFASVGRQQGQDLFHFKNELTKREVSANNQNETTIERKEQGTVHRILTFLLFLTAVSLTLCFIFPSVSEAVHDACVDQIPYRLESFNEFFLF